MTAATIVNRDLNPAHVVSSSQLFTATASGDACLFSKELAVQITGVATAITAIVERHPYLNSVAPDPASPNWAPADANAISGDPATGMVPTSYFEPGFGWWRVRVTVLTGASATVSMTGTGA